MRAQNIKLALLAAIFGLATAAPMGVSQESAEKRTTQEGAVEKRLEPPPYHDLYRGVYGSDFDVVQRDAEKRAAPVEPPHPVLYRVAKTQRDIPLPTPKYGDLYRSIAVEGRDVEPDTLYPVV